MSNKSQGIGGVVGRGEGFLAADLAANWDLLGIWSGRKYVRTKEIVRGTQAPIKKI